MGRLLVSIRGAVEAVAAAEGGAHIADVEDPSSALGTPYPLNIRAVRERLDSVGFSGLPISTNIGEQQTVRSSACQAALGVAVAGADHVKCGFAGLDAKGAAYLGKSLVRTVSEWCPESAVYPALFPEEEFSTSINPLIDGPKLAEEIDSAGLLIDTFRKDTGLGLLDYYGIDQLEKLVTELHSIGKEAWVAGSINKEELSALWDIEVDVVCVRGAACENQRLEGRFGQVTAERVRGLVSTIP